MMHNLPKFESEKAAKNLNKTYKIQCSHHCAYCLCFKNVVEAILTVGQTGPHTLRVITEGVDKPVFQMIWIAGYIKTNGGHEACKQSKVIRIDSILF